MLKTRLAAAVLLLIASVSSDSSAQSGISAGDPPQDVAENEIGPPQGNLRGTDEAPISVKIVDTEEAKQIRERGELAAAEKEILDRKLVDETQRLADLTADLAAYTNKLFWATAVLGAFTFALFLIAALGHRETSKAANASVKSTEQFREKERARLIASDVVCNVVVFDDHDPDAAEVRCRIYVRAQFYNYGATPALIGKTRIKPVIANNLPSRVTLRDVVSHPAYYQIPIMPGRSGGELEYSQEVTLSKEEARQIEGLPIANGKNVFVVGSIVYKDIFGVVRTFVFASKRKDREVVPTRGDDYNRDYQPHYEE